MSQDYPQLTLGNGRAGPQIQLRGLAIPKHTFPGPIGPIRGAPHSIIHLSKMSGRDKTQPPLLARKKRAALPAFPSPVLDSASVRGSRSHTVHKAMPKQAML